MKDMIYQWDSRHGSVFTDFVKSLNENGIRYFILRNYEGLPIQNKSKDVDIIIEPEYYEKAASLLLRVFKTHSISNYYVVKYERVRCWFGIDLEKDFAIHIDLIEGYLNKGFEIFSFETLYKQTHEYSFMRVLNDDMDACMLLLYKLICAKELKPAYRERIAAVFTSNKESIASILHSCLGGDLSNQVVDSLKDSDYDALEKLSMEISRKSKQIAFKHNPIKTSGNIVAFFIEKFYRILWCPKKYKKFIAVEAPDGTGKTTFIDSLCEKLALMFVCDIEKMHVYHFRPTLLPNLGAVGEKTGFMKQDTDFTNPHRNPPANPISSLFRLGYYWLDYIIGGFLCIRKDVQFDKFSIFDRYAYDFIVDPVRSRINLPRWMRSLFSRLVPQPQIVFVLMADAETIYARKQELTKEEINRQLKEFKRLKTIGKRCVMLDATKTPNEIVKDAMRIIINNYTSKC